MTNATATATAETEATSATVAVAAGGNSWCSVCSMPRSNWHILIGAGILAGQTTHVPLAPRAKCGIGFDLLSAAIGLLWQLFL